MGLSSGPWGRLGDLMLCCDMARGQFPFSCTVISITCVSLSDSSTVVEMPVCCACQCS